MSIFGKTILITGASRGLGRELARYFYEKGANLILVAKNSGLLAQALAGLSERCGQQVKYIGCDFANENNFEWLIKCIGNVKIDALINNAAIQGPIGPFTDNSWDEWKNALQINLLSPALLCQMLLPKMQNGSSIINISGGGATGSRANFSAYATAKTALVRFSETLAQELKESGIRVNCIAPGAMPTDMLREVMRTTAAGEKEINDAQKILALPITPFQKVAELCEFLISDRSKDITGKLISAIWDDWKENEGFIQEAKNPNIYTLRRMTSHLSN